MNVHLRQNLQKIASDLVERMLEEFNEGAECHQCVGHAFTEADSSDIADALVKAFCDNVTGNRDLIEGSIQMIQEILEE